MKKIIINSAFVFSLVLSGTVINAQQYGRGGGIVVPPPIAPPVRITPVQPLRGFDTPTLSPLPSVTPYQRPAPLPEIPGGGRGNGFSPLPFIFALTCEISDSNGCRLISEFYGTGSSVMDSRRLSDWTTAVTENRLLYVTVPQLVLNRREAIIALAKFEIEVIHAVETKIRQDIAKLEPFYWDSEETKRNKRETVSRQTQELNKIKKEAIEQSGSGNWNQSSSGSSKFRFNYGPAYRQLHNISKNGW